MLVFSAVMAVRQFAINESRHAEMREALIFLQVNGYNVEAERVYSRLLTNLRREPTRHLVDDLQRTASLVTTNDRPDKNIVLRYNMTIRRELDLRFERQYLSAQKLAGQSS